MKKLLYLYNDGHRAFPQLGRGGLGYKPSIKIIGGALHFVFNPETKKYETIDDLDNSDTNWYNADYGSTDHVDVMLKRSDNLLLEQERKNEERKTLEERLETYKADEEAKAKAEAEAEAEAKRIRIKEANKKKEEKERKKEEIRKKEEKERRKEEEEEEKIQTPTTESDKRGIIKLLNDTYSTLDPVKMDSIVEKIFKNNPYITLSEFQKDMNKYTDEPYKEVKKEKAKKVAAKREENKDKSAVNKMSKEGAVDNKGIAFEHVMINDNQQELKELSESKEDFKLASSNPIYYINGNIDDPIKINFHGERTPLHEVSLFDISNPKSIIDLKYYPNQEYSSIQCSKLYGSPSFTPCYAFINNKYVLYNIWCENTNSWVEKENYKEVSILSKLKGGNYNWSITNFLNSIVDTNGKTNCPMKQVKINGKFTEYGTPDVNTIFKMKGINTYKRPDNNNDWFDIPKKEMFKTNPETKKRILKK